MLDDLNVLRQGWEVGPRKDAWSINNEERIMNDRI